MRFWHTKGVWTSRNAANKISDITPDQVKSIAVIRHAALGDMVLTRAFLIEARRFFKNAKITLSVSSNYMRGIPEDLVDRVHVVHGADVRETPIAKRYKRIKELGYHDFIFDLAATTRSYMTCFFNPAKLKIGFPYRKIRAYMFYDVAVCRSDLNFEVSDMLNMLHVLGAKTAYPHDYNMPGEAVKRDRPYMVYFIGASTPTKCWPASHFTELLRYMSAEYPDHDHLVLEGIQEWETARAILEPIQSLNNVSAINTGTIEETVALLKGSHLLVSNDTGIRHLAIVSRIPTVGLFFNGPYRYWPRYDIHEAAMPDETGVPSVDEVKKCCIKILGVNRPG